MPSARSEGLPPLVPLTQISRRLSTPEYYHACVGSHPRTLEGPREVIFVLEGEGSIDPARWQLALDRVTAVHPGLRLRLVGKRRAARWQSDGPAPRLRVVEDCTWDGRSSEGAEFLQATAMTLEGPTVEVILVSRADGTSLVILRTLHAVMDGAGCQHVLQELFRALRGEAPLGSNAAFSDVDLMLSLGVRHSTSRHFRTSWLTGATDGDQQGDDWRRLSLGRPPKNLLAVLAAALAEFAHRYSELPALIAIPVNLRRHAPGLLASTNFSNMLFVRLDRGDGPQVFRDRLEAMLAQRMETVYPKVLDLVKLLPLPWFDLLVSRTPGNYRRRKPMETAVISNLGRLDPAAYSGGGFCSRQVFVLPLAGSAFLILSGIGDRVDLTINLPRVLSGNGRFDALESHLRERLAC